MRKREKHLNDFVSPEPPFSITARKGRGGASMMWTVDFKNFPLVFFPSELQAAAVSFRMNDLIINGLIEVTDQKPTDDGPEPAPKKAARKKPPQRKGPNRKGAK